MKAKNRHWSKWPFQMFKSLTAIPAKAVCELLKTIDSNRDCKTLFVDSGAVTALGSSIL